MRLLRVIALIFVSVLFFQCQKEVSHIGGPDPQPNIITPDPLQARLQGVVFDENGMPAQGVTVKVGSQSVTTDASGYFRVMNASLDKKSSLVTAEKTGYFKAYRTFAATSGTNQVVIKLIKKTLAGTIDAATGGSVTLSNGAKVALPASGVVRASDNSPYTGTVNVYASYIDPTAADIDQVVPGSFMATDMNGSRVVLASYGMMAVELESSSSEKLQVKTGSVATLTTPIPSAVQASAPQTIALWSVDEQTGIWKEEGTATKQGNVYVGDVEHFSFWNCDVPMNAIVLDMTLVDASGNPYVYAHVKISEVQNSYSQGHGWTDSAGQVSGFVPANSNLLMEVIDMCGNAIYSQNIGPFTQNTNLGNITVTPAPNSTLTITGQLLDCSSNPVTNGYALVSLGSWTQYAGVDASGNFSATYIICSTSPSTVMITAVDEGAGQQGTPAPFVVTLPATSVGTMNACGTSTAEYVSFDLDGVPVYYSKANGDSIFAYTAPQGTTGMRWTSIFASVNTGSGGGMEMNFFHPTDQAGTYPLNAFSVFNPQQSTLIQPFNIVVTNFPQNVGDFYEGTFSGAFIEGTNTRIVTNGNFRVRRFQ